MAILPPGTLLQLMYLRDRLRSVTPGRFLEIGPGGGEVTRLLLDFGWSGKSYDLEYKTISSLKQRFSKEINERRFSAINEDYLMSDPGPEKVDLIISCMVMEHLDDKAESAFMLRSADHLNSSGLMIGLVPASPKDWGIEDEIAGHYRRYTRGGLANLAASNGWRLTHIAGLTYPLSNLLLPLSNYLVNRRERSKLALPALERTKQSGRRNVPYKTRFPSFLALALNPFTLFPFHLVQKNFAKSQRALVLYFECRPNAGADNK